MKTKPSSIEEIRQRTRSLIEDHEKSIQQFHENHFPHLYAREKEMSDDICDRLVRFSKHKQCMSTDLEVEAAAEITRLREEVERLKSEESCNDVLLEYAQAENKRLRKENAWLRNIVRKYLEGSMREKDIRAAAAAIRKGDKNG